MRVMEVLYHRYPVIFVSLLKVKKTAPRFNHELKHAKKISESLEVCLCVCYTEAIP
jgi:hypothetical protein